MERDRERQRQRESARETWSCDINTDTMQIVSYSPKY